MRAITSVASLSVASLSVAFLFSSVAAQETPTERAAAAAVIRRMDSLEASLGLPALVARLTKVDARRDAVLARVKALMTQELLAMSDDITRHPEVGFHEQRSMKIVADYLRTHGFTVDTGVAGLPTAFVARYAKGTPGPNLGVIVEYDALRGTSRDFHGDQHSAQGPVGLAVAVALSEFLTRSKTPGTVTVYGTPAEEIASPPTKTNMQRAHVFDGAAAEFWLRYPDPVYLDEALALVQDAARAAALATGTKVRIDVDTASRDGISVGALNELAWAHLKTLGAGKLQPEAGRPVSFEETGSVSTQFPGIGVSAYSSNFANHTFGMEADALTDVGHNGFVVDAQTMAAVLYAFATDPPYRTTVQREFKGLQGLYADYLAALKTAYPLPSVAEPGAP